MANINALVKQVILEQQSDNVSKSVSNIGSSLFKFANSKKVNFDFIAFKCAFKNGKIDYSVKYISDRKEYDLDVPKKELEKIVNDITTILVQVMTSGKSEFAIGITNEGKTQIYQK